MHYKFLLLFLSTMLLTGYNYAQDIDTASLPGVWTLQQCIDYAKNNNIQIKSLQLTQESNAQDLIQSRANRYPTLNGTATQSYTHSKNVNPVVGGFQTQSSFAGNYALNSGVTIFNGGYINNDIKQKELLIKTAEFNVAAAQNDITLQVTQAYLSILLSKENIIYLEDLVQTSDSQYQQGTLKYNAGAIAKKDLVELKAQWANDKYNLINAENTKRQNQLNLKQLLQLPSGYEINVESPDTVLATTTFTPLSEMQSTAASQRPEVKSGELLVESANYDLKKAKALGLPSLTGSGSLSTGYSDDQDESFIRQLDNNFYQRIGLTLSIPIFNNRQVKTNIEKSKIAIDQANLNLQNTKTVLSQDVEQAYINVLNARSQYNAATEQLNAAQENYRISNDQLRLGAITSFDYVLQKNLYVQALQQYIQSKYNAIIAVKVYEFYKGTSVR